MNYELDWLKRWSHYSPENVAIKDGETGQELTYSQFFKSASNGAQVLKNLGVQKGDRVALNPFGSFVVRSRQAREGRNPKTGEKITIAARKVPAFVAGKSLKDAVSGARSRTRTSRKSNGL